MKQTKQQRIEKLETLLKFKESKIDELEDKVEHLEDANDGVRLSAEKSKDAFKEEVGLMFSRLGALIPYELREKINIPQQMSPERYHIRDNEVTLASAMGYLLAKANLDTKETKPSIES